MSSHYDGYKNALIKTTEQVLSKRIRIKPEVLSELFDCLLLELSQALDKIVAQAETSFLAEQKGNFFKFEEKKVGRHTLLEKPLEVTIKLYQDNRYRPRQISLSGVIMWI